MHIGIVNTQHSTVRLVLIVVLSLVLFFLYKFLNVSVVLYLSSFFVWLLLLLLLLHKIPKLLKRLKTDFEKITSRIKDKRKPRLFLLKEEEEEEEEVQTCSLALIGSWFFGAWIHIHYIDVWWAIPVLVVFNKVESWEFWSRRKKRLLKVVLFFFSMYILYIHLQSITDFKICTFLFIRIMYNLECRM